LADPAASADLIAFLQALPEGRKRRGDRYPQWFLLLMAILGILSGCRSARDLERFAKRHYRAFAAALDLELSKAPCDSTFLYLFERVELEQLFGLLREWMLAQIADQDKDFDQLICDGKTLRGSAAQPDGADGGPLGLSPRSRCTPESWALRLPKPRLTPANPTSARPSKPCSAPWSSRVC
jgi:hypothetical protein